MNMIKTWEQQIDITSLQFYYLWIFSYFFQI